jgi:ankyrin repeat protein
MNLLHMAAQGDKVGTVLYLDNKQFDINAQDSKKSTALHWASFAGSDKVV